MTVTASVSDVHGALFRIRPPGLRPGRALPRRMPPADRLPASRRPDAPRGVPDLLGRRA